MRVEVIAPDVSPANRASSSAQSNAFKNALDDVGSVLNKAEGAEDAFATGAGDLQTAIYERARADIALSVATAAAQRTAQALQSIVNMQV